MFQLINNIIIYQKPQSIQIIGYDLKTICNYIKILYLFTLKKYTNIINTIKKTYIINLK